MAANERDEFLNAFRNWVNLLPRETERALAGLFDLSAQRLVRLAVMVTGNQADAEDALQAAFSRIAAKPRLLANANTPWPYLIRIVRNESLRLLQSGRHGRAETEVRSVCQPSVEASLVHEETADSIRRILRSLPPTQYEVVILKHWEDLTFAEISEALGLSQNTVASRYRYALEKLQRSLEPLTR